MEDPAEIQVQPELDLVLSDPTFRLTLHAFLWVSSVAYASASTTNNIAEYWGLVHDLRQAKASDYIPVHVIGNSAIVLAQLQTRHPPHNQHFVRLFTEASAIANDIHVSSWGQH